MEQQRFAARKVHLDDPEHLRFRKHALPYGRLQRSFVMRTIDWIRAIRASKRTAIRELRNQRVRPVHRSTLDRDQSAAFELRD